MRTEKQSAGDAERRDLLRALADDTHSALLAELSEGKRTQSQLADTCELGPSVISRSLAHLRALGLISSGRGRDAQHELLVGVEMLQLLEAADRLAASVNKRRRREGRALSVRTDRAVKKWTERSRGPGGSSGAPNR